MKKYRLKKSVRRTIAALLMVTAIIVAALPAPSVMADGESSQTYDYPVPGDGVTFTFSTFTEDGETYAQIVGYDAWNDNGQGIESKDKIESLTIPEKVSKTEDNVEVEYIVKALKKLDARDGAGDSNALKYVYGFFILPIIITFFLVLTTAFNTS